MRDLDRALADIGAIRAQLAATTTFHGFGPVALAATGLLALLTATAQSLWLSAPAAHPVVFFAGWIATAVLAAVIVGVEMHGRSRRLHSGLADTMIHTAIVNFLPAAMAGAALALTLAMAAPQALWMLPGLWQVLVSLGVFAALRTLPRGVALVGAWYFLAGFAVLLWAAPDGALSPWAMGVPFAVGQLLAALVVHLSPGGADADTA